MVVRGKLESRVHTARDSCSPSSLPLSHPTPSNSPPVPLRVGAPHRFVWLTLPPTPPPNIVLSTSTFTTWHRLEPRRRASMLCFCFSLSRLSPFCLDRTRHPKNTAVVHPPKLPLTRLVHHPPQLCQPHFSRTQNTAPPQGSAAARCAELASHMRAEFFLFILFLFSFCLFFVFFSFPFLCFFFPQAAGKETCSEMSDTGPLNCARQPPLSTQAEGAVALTRWPLKGPNLPFLARNGRRVRVTAPSAGADRGCCLATHLSKGRRHHLLGGGP